MKIEKTSKNHVKFTFEVSVHDFEHALDHAFEHIKDKVEIKGFRKGHVTRSIYENRFGVESLFEDALNHVLHHKYHDALANKEYQIVGDPKPIIDIEKVKVGQPFEIAFEAAVKPEVVLGQYKGIEVEKLSSDVTSEEVSAKLNELLGASTLLEPKTEGVLETNDTAVFDFEGFKDGVAFEGGKAQNHELIIGSNQFIPGFEEQMIGMNIGEEKDLTLTFPEQYHAADLAGKEVVFKVKLNDIKVTVKPEVNDEWVLTLGREEKTVSELEKALEKEIKEQKESANKNATLEKALEKIAANTEIDVPVEMIEYEVSQAKKNLENQAKQYGLDLPTYISLTGQTEEQLNESLNSDANKRIINSLIIEAVAKAEKLPVSDNEVLEKYEELSKHYNMPVEEIKKHITEDLIRNDVEFSKALDFILDNVKYI